MSLCHYWKRIRGAAQSIPVFEDGMQSISIATEVFFLQPIFVGTCLTFTTPFCVTSLQLRNEFVFSGVISACEKSSRWQRAILLFQDDLMGEVWDRLCCFKMF